MTYGASFEVHVTVTAITIEAGSPIEIADHGKSYAGIARQLLADTQTGSGDPLITFHVHLQFRTARREMVDAWWKAVHTMDVEIELNEGDIREIRRERLSGSVEER